MGKQSQPSTSHKTQASLKEVTQKEIMSFQKMGTTLAMILAMLVLSQHSSRVLGQADPDPLAVACVYSREGPPSNTNSVSSDDLSNLQTLLDGADVAHNLPVSIACGV